MKLWEELPHLTLHLGLSFSNADQEVIMRWVSTEVCGLQEIE